MRCLDRLGANVLIQADANDGQWTGADGREHWQPLSWMGSAYRAVSDPTVHFAYAVNPFLVGNLADIPFDGQSAILERGPPRPRLRLRRQLGASCPATTSAVPALRRPQAPVPGPRAVGRGRRLARRLRAVGGRAGLGGAGPTTTSRRRWSPTFPFPVDRSGRGCVVAGR